MTHFLNKKLNRGEEVIKRVTAYQIRVTRKAKNMSQKKLANKIGKTKQEISKLEQGERLVGVDELEKISKALDTKLKIDFYPDNLDDYDNNYYIRPNFALPVGLIKELNKKAGNKNISTSEYVERILEGS